MATHIALVTGTSSGIGLSAAVHLAKAGFTVVATMRNLAKAERLRARAQEEGVSLDIRVMDVESDDSVHQCVADVLKQYGRVDVLVNNAGVGFFGTLEQTPLDAARKVLEVNFFGVWRTTQAVFPIMREQRSGRIINISSITGVVALPFNDAYTSAKFAMDGLMEGLAQVALNLGIHVSLLYPGPVVTDFFTNLVPGSSSLGGMSGPYKPMFDSFLAQSQAYFAKWQTGDDIARILVDVATTPQPRLRYPTSEDVRNMMARKFADLEGNASLPFPRLTGN